MNTNLELLDNGSFVLGVPITKIDIQKRIIGGFATLDNVDKAKDILDFNASRDAFSQWPGNVREMHEKKAVGKAIDIAEKQYDDPDSGETYDGMWVEAKISKGAEDTWQKVLDGTLCGFSVGGAIQEKQREVKKSTDGSEQEVWRVTKYSLNELSLVDNPCNAFAKIDLIKSVDGTLETTEILEKAPMKPMQPADQEPVEPNDDDMPDIQSIIEALTAWRDKEAEEGDDHDLAFISTLIQQLKERVFRGDPGNHGNDNAIFGAKEDPNATANKPVQSTDTAKPVKKPTAKPVNAVKPPIKKDADETNKFGIQVEKELESEGEILHNNENSDISIVDTLTDENKSLVRKFLEFITKTTSEEQVEKEDEMDEATLKGVIGEATEALTKTTDEKFSQVGESLTKVADALEKLAKTEQLDELKTAVEDSMAKLAARVETLEQSGATQKSADDAGDTEKLEKSEKGFWASAIVPEFIQNEYKAGR